jgi:hypothetical protein
MLLGMRAQLLFFCSVAASVLAQPNQAQQDPKDLLLSVRRKVMETVRRLPRYMCTETIDRTQYEPDIARQGSACDQPALQRKLHVAESDRLRLDVGIAANGEIYSWVGENRFDDRSLFDIVRQGAVQTGSYRSFLLSVFESEAASFSYNGDESVNGRTMVEFGYRVPLEKSTYVFGNRGQHVTTGYEGTFLVDPQTADLARLTVSTDQLPPEVSSCHATTTLDYARVRLNEADFLLPAETHLRILNLDGVELENRAVFSSCHEFVGKSKLSFDAPEPEAGTESSGKSSAFAWPENRQFDVTFTQGIDTAKAAAGDSIQAKLKTAIRDASSTVIAKEGSAVTGRIVKLQHFFGAKSSSLMLAVKLETVEVNGTPQPISAEPFRPGVRFARDNKGLSRRVELGSLDNLEDPAADVFDFRDVKANFLIKEGLESNWVTTKPEAPTATPAP